mmetsp:Transcript_12741/g.18090  ORF Transcript_12741/g.18090 Transcript_12741/m.18090 type:complete len:339 (+) Transcript_12741:68-1084(+)
MARLVYWYDTPDFFEGKVLSLVPPTVCLTYCDGVAKGLDQIPRKIQNKISLGKRLDRHERHIVRGIEQMREDFEKEPEFRVEGKFPDMETWREEDNALFEEIDLDESEHLTESDLEGSEHQSWRIKNKLCDDISEEDEEESSGSFKANEDVLNDTQRQPNPEVNKHNNLPSKPNSDKETNNRVEAWWAIDLNREPRPTWGATPLVARCMRHYRWSANFARRAVVGYKLFLHLKKEKQDWDGKILEPSVAVGKMWVQHVLDIRKYSEDCMLLCGHIVNYSPDGDLDKSAKAARVRATKLAIVSPFEEIDEAVWNFERDGGSAGRRESTQGTETVWFNDI